MICRTGSRSQSSLGIATAMSPDQLDLMDYATKRKEALARAEALREQKKHELEQRGQQVRKYSWGGVPTGFHSVNHTWRSPDEDPRVLLGEDNQRLSLSPSGGGRTPRQRRKPLLDTNIDGASLMPRSPRNRDSEFSSHSSVNEQDGVPDSVGKVRCLACQCKHSASVSCDAKATSSTPDHALSSSLTRAKTSVQAVLEETSRRLSSETVTSSLSDGQSAASFQYMPGGEGVVLKLDATRPPNSTRKHEAQPSDDSRSLMANVEPLLGEHVKGKGSLETTGSSANSTFQGSGSAVPHSSHAVAAAPNRGSSAMPMGAGTGASSMSREGKGSTNKKTITRGLMPSSADVYGSLADDKGAAAAQEDHSLTAGSLAAVANECARSNGGTPVQQKEMKRKGDTGSAGGDRQRRHSEAASLDGQRRRDSTAKKSSSVETLKRGVGVPPLEHTWSPAPVGMPNGATNERGVLSSAQTENLLGEDARSMASKPVEKKVKHDRYPPEALMTTGRGEVQRGREGLSKQVPREVAGRRHTIAGAAVIGHGSERQMEDPYGMERVSESILMGGTTKNVESEDCCKKGEEGRPRLPVSMEMAMHDAGHLLPQRMHSDTHAKHQGKEEGIQSHKRVVSELANDRHGGGKPGAEGGAPAGQGGSERGRTLVDKVKVNASEAGMKAGIEKFDMKGRGSATEGVGGRKLQLEKSDPVRKGSAGSAGGGSNDEGLKKSGMKPEQPKKLQEPEMESRKHPQSMKTEIAKKPVLNESLAKKRGSNGLIAETSLEKVGNGPGAASGAAGTPVPLPDKKKILQTSESILEKRGNNGLAGHVGVADRVRKGMVMEMRKEPQPSGGSLSKKKGSGHGLLVAEGNIEKAAEMRAGVIDESHSRETCEETNARPFDKEPETERMVSNDCGAEQADPYVQGSSSPWETSINVDGVGIPDNPAQEKKEDKRSRRASVVGRNEAKRDTSKKHNTVVRHGTGKTSSLRQASKASRRDPYEVQQQSCVVEEQRQCVVEEQHQRTIVEESVAGPPEAARVEETATGAAYFAFEDDFRSDSAAAAAAVECPKSEDADRVEMEKGIGSNQQRTAKSSLAEKAMSVKRLGTEVAGEHAKSVSGDRTSLTIRAAGSAGKLSRVKVGRVSTNKSSSSQHTAGRGGAREASTKDGAAGRVPGPKVPGSALQKTKNSSAAAEANNRLSAPEGSKHNNNISTNNNNMKKRGELAKRGHDNGQGQSTATETGFLTRH